MGTHMIDTARAWGRSLALRLPAALESYWSLRRLCGRRYLEVRRWERFNAWLRELDLSAPPELPGRRRRVLFFSTLQDWIDVGLATAVGLVGHHCAVDYAWLDSQVDQPRTPTPHQRRVTTWARRTASAHPHLRVIDLWEVPVADIPAALADDLHRQSVLDTQYHYQREEIDLEDSPEHQAWYEYRMKQNRDLMARLLTLLQRQPYDVLVVPNAAMLEFGAAYRLARWFGIPCTSFEYSEQKQFATISDNAPCVFQDLTALWQADEPHVMDGARRERILGFLQARENASLKNTILYQKAPVLTAEELRGRLAIPAGRRVALLCTNLAWDSAVVGQQLVYPSMAAWIRSTVSWFAARRDWQLVVRVHPAEAMWTTSEPAVQIIAKHLGTLPDNLTVIAPTDTTNTYGLMRLCEFGLAYTSTVGLEMATKGMPVVVAGKVHYRGHGFTIDPETQESFRETLDTLTAAPARLSARQVELALCYADLYFHDWPRPFPWNNASFDQDVADWPLARVLSPEGRARFSPTFEFLAGRSSTP